jgi:ribosome-associated protein
VAAKSKAKKPSAKKNAATPKTAAVKAAKPKTPRKPRAGKAAGKAIGEAAVEKLKKLIETSLDDDKAENIVAIDLRNKSSIADWLVIASGRSSRQVAATAEHLLERLKAGTGKNFHSEGKRAGDWVLIDAGDIIVHLFQPDTRTFYNLEKMWSVDLPDQAV